MFVGTFEHSLDGKGRVVLPSTFRDDLDRKCIIGPYEHCLGVWTLGAFAELAQRLTDKVREGKAPHNAVRALAANSVQVETDTQGRILIPQRLRDFAQLERDVAIIGAIDRIEIWPSETWQRMSTEADQSLIDAVTGLGI